MRTVRRLHPEPQQHLYDDVAPRRNLSRCLNIAIDPVADARDRFYNRRVTKFPAQPADGYADSPCERVGVLVPDLFEKIFSAQDSRLSTHKRLQNCELLGRKIQGSPVSRSAVAQRVELHPAGPEDPRSRAWPATRQGADPE